MGKKYQIALHGCDDSTYIKLKLTEDELKFVKKLCRLSEKESTYGCMPTMEVKEDA